MDYGEWPRDGELAWALSSGNPPSSEHWIAVWWVWLNDRIPYRSTRGLGGRYYDAARELIRLSNAQLGIRTAAL